MSMQNFMPLQKEVQLERDAIDLGFQKTAKEKARIMAEEEVAKHGKLLPQHLLQERYEKELEQEFVTLRKRLQNGASKIVESLKQLCIHDPEMMAQDVLDAFTHISGLSEVIQKDEQAFNEKFICSASGEIART